MILQSSDLSFCNYYWGRSKFPLISNLSDMFIVTHICSFEQVRKHLQDFFERSKQSLSAELNQELFLMCTQCYEVYTFFNLSTINDISINNPSHLMQDALVKGCSSLSFDDQVSTCAGLLRDGQRVLEQNEPAADASMEYLEGIAKVRYALMVVAELLHREPSTPIMVQTMVKVATQASKNVTNKQDSEESLSDSAEDKEEESTSQNELEPQFEPSVLTEVIGETEVVTVDTQPTDITAYKEQEQTAQPKETVGSFDDSKESTPSTTIMVQTVAKGGAQPSQDMTEQEDSKEQRQLSESAEDKKGESTSQSRKEPEFQPLVPTEVIEETNCIEVETLDTQPTDITADKEQEQTAQPQETVVSFDDSKESTPSTPSIMVQTVAKGGAQPSKDMTEQEDSDEGQLLDGAEDKQEEGTSQNELEPVFQPLVPTEPIEKTEHIEVEIIDTPPTDISADEKHKQTPQPQVTSGFVDELEESTPSIPIMVQNVAEEAAQPSKDMAEQEVSKEERQLSDSAEDKKEEGTLQNEIEPEFQPLVPTEPIDETECIEVEIVDTRPTDVSGDKEQEQTGQPQEIGEFVEESEESIPKLKVSAEENMDTGYTEVAEAQHPLIASTSVESDAGSEADPATQLLLAAQSACEMSLTAGPSHYLLKMIVRQFGFSFLRKLVKVHPWVIPQGITWTGQVHTCSCM